MNEISRTNLDRSLEVGCYFGHLRRKWNPAIAPYIFMKRNGVCIINPHKTVAKVDEATEVFKGIARSGRKILFVVTKRQAKEVVAERTAAVNMPYVDERRAGGMLTSFPTTRKAVKKMTDINKLMNDGTFFDLSKCELLQTSRQHTKLGKNLGSISDLTRLPSALFVVGVMKEYIAVKEINCFSTPIFGIVDISSDPKNTDCIIPASDDAKDSVETIFAACYGAITEDLEECEAGEADKKAAAEQAEEAAETKPKRVARRAEEAPKIKNEAPTTE